MGMLESEYYIRRAEPVDNPDVVSTSSREEKILAVMGLTINVKEVKKDPKVTLDEMSFGEALGYLMVLAGTNASQLADQEGLPRPLFTKIIKDGNLPTSPTLSRIIAAFGWGENDPRKEFLTVKRDKEKAERATHNRLRRQLNSFNPSS